jgi:putative ABC transport system permease protein
MFAFGLPIRTVVRMTMLENLVTGILGTLMGLGLGYVATLWMLNTRMSVEMPDISLPVTLSALSILLAVILGTVVVAFTPLFSIRKMMQMNLPSTLRVVE